jgi:anti-anti-sigma factor
MAEFTRSPPLSGQSVPDVAVRVSGFRAVTLFAAGEIDALGAPMLQAALNTAWHRGARRVTVDLTAVSFLNGAGLRVLARARTTARQRRAALTVRVGTRQMCRLLELVGLRDVTVARPAAAAPAPVLRPWAPPPHQLPGRGPAGRSDRDGRADLRLVPELARGDAAQRMRVPTVRSEEASWTSG